MQTQPSLQFPPVVPEIATATPDQQPHLTVVRSGKDYGEYLQIHFRQNSEIEMGLETTAGIIVEINHRQHIHLPNAVSRLAAELEALPLNVMRVAPQFVQAPSPEDMVLYLTAKNGATTAEMLRRIDHYFKTHPNEVAAKPEAPYVSLPPIPRPTTSIERSERPIEVCVREIKEALTKEAPFNGWNLRKWALLEIVVQNSLLSPHPNDPSDAAQTFARDLRPQIKNLGIKTEDTLKIFDAYIGAVKNYYQAQSPAAV